jgi:uncharacterized protein YndB with AHSA1/START domain
VATVTASAEVRAELAELWSLWTDPARMPAWLPVISETGHLCVGASFSWLAAAPFVAPVRTTGRVRQLDACRRLELELDMRFSPTPSAVTIELASTPGRETTTVSVRHDGLPDSDLGLFETHGYGHYWWQHLESLTACAERRPSDHHHPQHVGVYFVGGHPTLGVLVGGVVRGSPVHEAGLQAGDVLQAVDGTPVRSIVEFDSWLDHVEPGATARFSLLRTELPVRIPDTTEEREGGEHDDRHHVRVGPR